MAEFPIIEKLGGRDKVFERLRELGLAKTPRAIGMWSAPDRGVIPGDAARELMRWADELKIDYSVRDFELPPEVATPRPRRVAQAGAR
jgi:hypothetical protein